MTPQEIAARLPELTGGPHDDATITALAQITAEAVRVLNHATRDPGAITEPATTYAVTANLAAAVYALPQLCGQLTGWLDREAGAGRLACDDNRPVQTAAGAVRSRLRTAAVLAAELGAALAAAQAVASHLKRPGGSGEDQ